MDDVGQFSGIFNRGRNIHYTSDIRPTMTHKNPYPRFLIGDIPLRRIYPLSSQFASPVVEILATLGTGSAGAEYRLRDIYRTLQSATYKDHRPDGLHRIVLTYFGESV